MSNVFYRNPAVEYPVAVRGEGAYLFDAEGNAYLDASGGAAISCLGHGHPAVIAAMQQQAERLAFAHTGFFTTDAQEDLSEQLARLFGERDARVYFLSGGSEANETAIKMARQYWLALGWESKHIIISRRQSYHGNTLGALSVTGHLKRRMPYLGMLQQWPRIAPCYAYRLQEAGESDADFAARSAAELEQAILQAGPDKVAAFMAETVVGASLGAVPAAAEYFSRVRDICDRYEVLLILDEVMAGSGRTGSYFAFEQENVRPDIVTLAKGLAGGYQPIGAAIARGFVHDTIALRLKSFTHGHSYVGHAVACATALAVTRIIDEEGLIERVQTTGNLLRGRLEAAFADHPNIGDIRGRGLMLGLECVLDKDSKEPVPAADQWPMKLKHAAMRNGLICYPGGGTADGTDGAHILLAPPFIFTEQHVDELVDKLGAALAEVVAAG